MKPVNLHLAILSAIILGLHARRCQQIDTCRCRLSDGREINLHPIGNTMYEKRWPDDGLVYTFSPCSTVPCGQGLKKVSVCVTDVQRKSKSLGYGDTARFEEDGASISLKYLAKDKLNTSSVVHLMCSTSTGFEISHKLDNRTYEFQLFSPCACPNGCMSSLPGMSIGSVLLLTFFSCLLLYFGVGSLYRISVYGAEGREIIPNTSFWCSLPGLVKDGYLFFISPCLGDRVEYRTYEKL